MKHLEINIKSRLNTYSPLMTVNNPLMHSEMKTSRIVRCMYMIC